MRFPLYCLAVLLALGPSAGAAEKIGLQLLPQATSGSRGVFLQDLVVDDPEQPVPQIELAPAPAIGRPYFLTRYQIADLLQKKAPEIVCTNWTGAERVRVLRATRVLDEATVKQMLTATLQEEVVKDRGELELRMTRPWTAVALPDEPLTIKILELPVMGVTSSFICRFEVLAGGESAGVYQQSFQARIWRDVYVAASNLIRGQLLRDANVTMEKRDLLSSRDVLTDIPLDDPYIELRENVPAGAPLSSRMFRLRAIIKRGRLVDATVQEDSMTISVKAEALEDGVPGQIVRLRNLRSKREFKGKVQDEQTVAVIF